MRRLGLASAVLLAALRAASAAPRAAEDLKAGAGAAFQAAAAVRFQPPVTLKAALVREAEGRLLAGSKGTRPIRLTGNVFLDGTGHAPQGSSWVTVTLSGWVNLRDDQGRPLSGSVHLSDTQTFFMSGNHVSGWARPYAYVSVYDGGRYLGSVRIEGDIHVSGWNTNGWVRLSGSGYVSGTLWAQD